MDDRIETIEFEALVLGRHLSPTRLSPERPHPLERSAYTLLRRLALQGPMSIKQLSEAFALDVSTLNRQTAALVRDGLAERIPDPEGGVARKFRVTEVGLDRLAGERRANTEGLQRVLAAWSEEDLATLADMLRRFNADIERRDGRPWPRGD